MALGFGDLEKAFDTVPREMVMATLRWMGVPEPEVIMVEGMYEKTTARVVWEKEHRRCLGQYWTEEGQRAEPATVHSSTGPHQQEDGDEGCHEETSLCRRSGPWWRMEQSSYRDTGGVERVVDQAWAETQPIEDGSPTHRPPERRAGHRAGGEETDPGGQFRVHGRGCV